MKRRRIREIVAAAASATWTVWPYEVVVFSDGRWTLITGGVHIETPARCLRGPSKRATLEAALAAFGQDREWPELTGDERWLLNRGKPFCAIARSQGRGDLWLWEHLREPVKLP